MKQKKIASLCKERKRIYLYDTWGNCDVEQWIGNGWAMYPMVGLPRMEEANVFAMWDVADKDRDGYVFRHYNDAPSGYCLENNDSDESYLKRGKISIVVNGSLVTPLDAQSGVIFIDEEYLKPIFDMADALDLYERKTKTGEIYIAVKAGMLLCGIVKPHTTIIDRDVVTYLQRLTGQCMNELQEKERRERDAQEGEPTQTSISVDGEMVNSETGEVIE